MQTPFEASDGQWTSWEDGETFLDDLAAITDIELTTLAHTVEGRPIRAALIGAHPDEADQVCLMAALQHGNEPAGREGAYAAIRNLAQTEAPELLDYLTRTAWVVIPTINGDRLNISRRNAHDVDLNRDWEDATQPETQAVQHVLDTWQPTVVLDAHEVHSPFVDVGMSIPSIDGIHPGIRQLAYQAREHIIPHLVANGSEYQHYGESNAMVLRNWAGLHHAVTLLVETYALNDERPAPLRVQDHITVFHALVDHHESHYQDYRYAAEASRGTLTFHGGAPPFFDMWSTPKAQLQGAAIVDAYLQTEAGAIRVYDNLHNVL